MPLGPWVMAQQWCDLLFAHWPIPTKIMRALVPDQLRLDLWEKQAWLGVVPFRMQGVRPRGIPSVPWLSAFPELNVRTYVTVRDRGIDKAGVYFFSLEAANPVAVKLARTFFKLPYFHAEMELEKTDTTIHYRSRRTHHNATDATFVGTYGPVDTIYRAEPGSFDAWLTERYALYTVGQKGEVYIGEIHHEPWPLQPANLLLETNSVATANSLTLPAVDPILHFAHHIDVAVWPLRKIN